ncbi:hypothetical protein QBC37DRAFT_407678 [Rhypophila decipiens]|uniref:Uncharacterized protein n=1 Tax=Rhypophila decipiens TaxID=261697 RepID=A0AAN6YPK1_9PEZI|nr:hypothetical protein QBC37DRAFT_407678 [Rhypophila decipiens]
MVPGAVRYCKLLCFIWLHSWQPSFQRRLVNRMSRLGNPDITFSTPFQFSFVMYWQSCWGTNPVVQGTSLGVLDLG